MVRSPQPVLAGAPIDPVRANLPKASMDLLAMRAGGGFPDELLSPSRKAVPNRGSDCARSGSRGGVSPLAMLYLSGPPFWRKPSRDLSLLAGVGDLNWRCFSFSPS
eukprot:1326028-Pyramimonas_sp.AAC.1